MPLILSILYNVANKNETHFLFKRVDFSLTLCYNIKKLQNKALNFANEFSTVRKFIGETWCKWLKSFCVSFFKKRPLSNARSVGRSSQRAKLPCRSKRHKG